MPLDFWGQCWQSAPALHVCTAVRSRRAASALAGRLRHRRRARLQWLPLSPPASARSIAMRGLPPAPRPISLCVRPIPEGCLRVRSVASPSFGCTRQACSARSPRTLSTCAPFSMRRLLAGSSCSSRSTSKRAPSPLGAAVQRRCTSRATRGKRCATRSQRCRTRRMVARRTRSRRAHTRSHGATAARPLTRPGRTRSWKPCMPHRARTPASQTEDRSAAHMCKPRFGQCARAAGAERRRERAARSRGGRVAPRVRVRVGCRWHLGVGSG